MKKRYMQAFILLGIFFVFSLNAYAHCEIPCGIYDDEMRIEMIREHILTIEKSMKQIAVLEKGISHHSNQLVRWVMNKENHADELQDIVAQYFMTQRITPDAKDYEKKIGLLHQMLIYSMKCKQTTDLSNVETLRKLVDEFSDLYFKK